MLHAHSVWLRIFRIALVLFISCLVAQLSSASQIYFADFGTDSIRRINSDGTGLVTLVSTGTNIIDVKVDAINGYIYWTENVASRIRRSDLDGSNIVTLIDRIPGSTTSEGIALDLDHGKVYWTDDLLDEIWSANLDGTDPQAIVTGLGNPYGIDYARVSGKVYWADWNNKIGRSNFDGSDAEAFNVSVGPYDLAIDELGGHVYAVDYFSSALYRTDLAGGNLVVLDSPLSPRGIALDRDAGKMYYTSDGSDRIYRANLDGTGVEVFLETGLINPSGIFVVPEPGTLWLIGAGVLGVRSRRRPA